MNILPATPENAIHTSRIRTGRLELVPASLAILASDLRDRTMLARLLDATVPPAWPPPLLDTETLAEFVRMKTEKTDPLFVSWYWVLVDPATKTRTLVGSGGIASFATEKDTVILGYSVLDEFQNRGYATEAIRGMVPVIFSLPGIRKIMATTYPHLKPSIRVLEKTGFACTGACPGGEGLEEGTLAFILEKPSSPGKTEMDAVITQRS